MAISYSGNTTLESLENPAWTYTFKIDNLKIRDVAVPNGSVFTATVVQTYWKYSGVTADGANTGTFSGATPLTLSTEVVDFVPFDQLDEATVVGWVKSYVTGSYAAHVHEKINEQVNATINVISQPDLPWAVSTST
jgi:hypothetical protein